MKKFTMRVLLNMRTRSWGAKFSILHDNTPRLLFSFGRHLLELTFHLNWNMKYDCPWFSGYWERKTNTIKVY